MGGWSDLAKIAQDDRSPYPEGKVPATVGAIVADYLATDPMDSAATIQFVLRIDKLRVLRR